MAKKLGEMWNNLSDSEKQPYINKAAKLKEKYEKVRGQEPAPPPAPRRAGVPGSRPGRAGLGLAVSLVR